MKNQRFTFLVAVHAFFIKDNKILLLQRQNTGFRDGEFSVPAGHVDGGEKIVDALKREVLEETGIHIREQLEPAHVMHRAVSTTEERIDYFFVIERWEGEPHNAEPDKCAQLLWSSFNDLPDLTIPYVKSALSQVKKGKKFSEFEEQTTV